MPRKLATLIISILSVIGLGAAPALAWDYGLTGSGACQPDGSYKITWTIDNSQESQTLTVKSSSNTTVVPVGTTVAAGQTANFTETESGKTAPATYSLTLDVTWPGDQSDHDKTAAVTLAQACTQPTPPPTTPPTTPPQTPPTGGRGGGGTPITTTATPPTPTPQVAITPTEAVNAGEGGATHTSPAALGGLAGSLATIGAGLGLRRKFAGKDSA